MGHSINSGNPYTSGIARFVSTFSLENVPSEVIHRAKLLFLDSLGCGLYGARLDWTKKAIAALSAIDQTNDTSNS